MRVQLRCALSLVAAAGFTLGAAETARADGNGVLGWSRTETGHVDLATAQQSSFTYTPYPVGLYDGTLALSGLPTGAVLRSVHLYYTSTTYNWSSKGPTLLGVTFDGQSVPIQQIGLRNYSWPEDVYYTFRADVTSLVTGNGVYDVRFDVRSYWYGPGWTPRGAALLAIYEDPDVTADYRIEVADGANTGYFVLYPYNEGPRWTNRHTTFTGGWSVDATPQPEVELVNFVCDFGYGVEWAQLLNVTPTPAGPDPTAWAEIWTGAHAPPGLCTWHRLDVSSYLAGGESTLYANMAERPYARIGWSVAALRVRTGPLIVDDQPPSIEITSHDDGVVVASSPTEVEVAVRDASGCTITSVPPLDWNPGVAPPETMVHAHADYYLVEGPNDLVVTAADEYANFASDAVTIVLDTVWPAVTITSPPEGLVTNAGALELAANVVDATTAQVSSTPAGIDELVEPDPGGAPVAVSALVALVEGENVLSVTATDEALHSSGATVTVVRDSTPPALTIDSPAPLSVYGLGPATLTVSVVDATPTTVSFGSQSFLLAQGNGTVSGDVDLLEGMPPAQPANHVVVTAVDAAGNTTQASIDLVLDLTAPVVGIVAPLPGGSPFGPGQETIEVTASVDDLTATSVSSTPAGVTGGLPAGGGLVVGWVDLVEGSNTITVRALDQTAREGSASISVVLDTTPPDVSILSPLDDQAVRGAIDFDATALDVGTGSGVALVELYVDTTLLASFGAAPFFATLDTTALGDGAHTLTARAVDGVGNERSTVASVRADNTPPSVSIDAPTAGAYVSDTLTIVTSAADSGTGLVELAVRVGGAPPNTSDGSASFSPPSPGEIRTSAHQTDGFEGDGPLILEATAWDEAGNSSATSFTVTVDNSAPEWALLAPVDGSTVSGTIDLVAATDEPNLARIELLVDGASIALCGSSPCIEPFDTLSRLDGAMTVTAIATDLAGNTTTCTAHVTVDNVSVALSPQTLNLKSKGKANSITVELEGANLALLTPIEEHALVLRVPGGNPVPATLGFAGSNSLADSDGDGLPELTVKFDRQLLIGAIQSALAAGLVQAGDNCAVTLVADGDYEIGSDLVRINSK